MALINNIYVLAEKEDKKGDVELTTHPTESGFPITDSVRKNPITINISGKIAQTENLTAKQIVEKLEKLRDEGSVIKYIGQCGTINNLQIQNFDPSYHHKNFGGADFSMTLVEFKTAKSAYTEMKTTVKPTTVTNKTLKVGDTVFFLGGNVYVSSDATKAAAKRGKSTCKLTKISTLANAKHIYHLISKDCKYGSSNYVYGWVDEDRVTSSKTIVAPLKNGGTQQVIAISDGNAIYHTVKKGETVWGIVNKTYKSYGFSVNKVIKDNPKAFSTPNKATTLQIGAKLKLVK